MRPVATPNPINSKGTRLRRFLALALAIAVLWSPTAFADQVDQQRTRVQTAKSRISDLEQRLASLLADLTSMENEFVSTSGRLGVSELQVLQAEQKVAQAQQTFFRRARRAYMNGGSRGLDLVLRARSFFEFLTSSRILGASLSADAEAHRELIAARDALTREREEVGLERQSLLQSTHRLTEVRTEIRSALQSEQTLLSSAQAELDKMLAERRRASVVSPAVEARRSARQAILDRKLSELLAWYAPGKGVEPFMPPRLKDTGIVTTGLTSWYGPGFDGRRASSGATYRMNDLTAASLVLPFGTMLKVTFRDKSVVVVITDRGPYIRGRVLDLSWGAAEALGVSGVKEVRMEIVVPTEPAPPFP